VSTTQAGKTTGQEPKEHAAQLARMLEDAFNDYEDWKIEEAVGEHFLDHATTMGGVGFRERARLIRQMLDHPKLHIEEIMVTGSLIASRWSLEGRHTGKMLGFQPTNEVITVHGLNVDRLEDGRSVEHWEFPDMADLIQQLEAASAPRETKS